MSKKSAASSSAVPPALCAVREFAQQRRILVAPTWQRAKPLFISTPEFYERLIAWAEREQAVAFVKLHPFLAAAEQPRDVPGRLYFLDAGVDIYPWMSRFDAKITDYSSITFDFLFTEKPIFSFESRTQVSYGFEPDWSLIPNIPFRYSFDAHSFERVLDDNFVRHPLQDSQRRLREQFFESDPRDASAQLIRLIAECNTAALQRPLDLISADDDHDAYEPDPAIDVSPSLQTLCYRS